MKSVLQAANASRVLDESQASAAKGHLIVYVRKTFQSYADLNMFTYKVHSTSFLFLNNKRISIVDKIKSCLWNQLNPVHSFASSEALNPTMFFKIMGNKAISIAPYYVEIAC